MPHFSIFRFCPQVSALLVFATSLAGSCVTAFSAEVDLAWDAKSEPEIIGYKIYYQGTSRVDLRSIDVGNVTTFTVSGLDPDTYYFCVTAYDLPGYETSCSNVVSITLSPPMYGFRDESTLSKPGVLSQLTLHSRNVSETCRSIHSAQEDLFASSSPLACRLRVPKDSRYQEPL